MLLSDASFVVVDVETTGLSAAHHRIMEIAMVRVVHGAITERFQTLLNPEQYIPPFITQHTGISNAMVFGKPKFCEVLPTIKQFIASTGAPVLTGHNVGFDHGFVMQSFERSGDSLIIGSTADTKNLLCTCRLARRLLPKLQRRSLKHVQDYFGIKNIRQHRALGDAEATAKILTHFLEMASEMEVMTLEDFLRLQYAKPNYGRRRTKKQLSLREEVKLFPERPGVYTMRNSAAEVLYVGKAKNLHNRVASYFAESHTQGTKLAKMMRLVKSISYEETGSELSALLLESRRIKELNPRFNSLERRYKSQAFLKLDIQHPFPKISFSREPGQDGAEYYGPFRSRESVEALVEVLNRSFTLRECKDHFAIGPEVKPCLYHEINRCNAPCALLESQSEYRKEVERLRRFLAAGEEGILAHVEQMIRTAAERLDFEEAQFLKIRLLELRRVLGQGERVLASINANDFVILNKVPGGGATKCEVLFVRFGMLVKQIVLDHTHLTNAEEWFFRQMRLYYGATPVTAKTAGKPDVDEMRILSRWLEQTRKRGSHVVYLAGNGEDSVASLVRELREVLGESTDVGKKVEVLSVPPVTAPRERRLVLKPMKV
jgi:DNA polymerase-3 subunit epsilon